MATWNKEKMGSMQKSRRFAFLMFLLVVILIFVCLLSISVGVADSNIHTVLQMLLHTGPYSPEQQIIIQMRIPRALASCMAGAAFSVAGAVMQGIGRNPLADSGLLGINAGAGFIVALGSVLLGAQSFRQTMFLAFIGAVMAACMVYGLGYSSKGGLRPIRLLLAGAAVSAFLTALSQGIALSFGLAKELTYWSAGSLSGVSWDKFLIAFPWIVTAVTAAFFLSPQLTLLGLGEDSAASLGLNIKILRIGGLMVVLVLAGVSVSLAGGISFLGLMVPHISRFLVGADYQRILPVTALCGGILLVLADIAARMVNAPFDTPVGALVSLIGVPFFLGLTYRRKGVLK